MKRRSILKFLALLGIAPKVAAKTASAMTHDHYCINVCGGKCCKYMRFEGKTIEARCPQLTDCNRCGMHDKWKDGSCGYSFPVQIGGGTIIADTAPVEYAIKNHLFPKWIEDQCCYAHPELLEKV